jgi:hypothetical protein
MKDLLRDHFEAIMEMFVLVLVFVIGALLLAYFPDNERLAGWITGGTIIGVLARALQTRNKARE